MQEPKGLFESIASGLGVLNNATLPSIEVLEFLQQDDLRLVDLLRMTCSYVVVVSVIIVLLITYFYIWLPINWIKDCPDFGYPNIKDTPQRRKSKKELVEEVRRRRQLGDMPPVYPNRWFALLESTDLKAGQVKHVQGLGEAVMRTDTGGVHVLDAYCPHLGANMAVGGVVRGDCLECPFHGWQFCGEDGTCSHIPYSAKVPKGAVVKKWTSSEVNGLVFVWYHAEGEPPSWQIQGIPEVETGKLWYRGRVEFYSNVHIQDYVENLADSAHFQMIHVDSMFAGGDCSSSDRLIHRTLKHVWNLKFKLNSSTEESHMLRLIMNHRIKLFNKFTVLPMSTTVTQIERDAMVWNHKRFAIKPVFVKEDETIQRFRRWFSQFYTEHSPRVSFKQKSIEW